VDKHSGPSLVAYNVYTAKSSQNELVDHFFCHCSWHFVKNTRSVPCSCRK